MNSIFSLSGIKNKRINFLLIFILLNLCLQANAEVIKVRGIVLNDAKEPVANVNITNMEDSSSVSTNEDGKYAITVSNRGKLKFTHMNYATETVNVKGQLKIDVLLKKRALMIQEVVVSGRLKKKKDPVIEPTDIEIHGNWAIVRTSVSPNAKFKSYNRLLMQPYVYNETKKQKFFLKPVSLDGREYDITQTRMYDFNIKKDPLAEYIVKKESERIPYVDSLYMENINDLWRCDAVQTVENYQDILFSDTVVIANGVVNPLKFMKFNFGGDLLSDSSFFPMDEPQLRDDRDEMHLKFPLGKADLDLRDSATVADLTLLKKKLKDIESNQDAQLSTFEIAGSASPEGNYEWNIKLAAQRMGVAMQNILSVLSEGTRENLKPKKSSNVESWQTVADLMTRDSLNAQAGEIRAIVQKYPRDITLQGKKIARLPFYNVVATKYLPRLRKVEYRYFFKIYRSLTAGEIRELYEKNYKELTKFEFFKLYRSEKDSLMSEAMARRALEVYPNFMVAACDLSAMCLKRGCGDAKILERFVGEKAPEQVSLNQIVTLLHERQFSKADSILGFIKDNRNTRVIKAYTEVLNHRFNDDNFKVVAESGKVNEVLMLLAMKKNNMAYKAANELKAESAENFYIKAMCANRASKGAADINSNAMLYMEALDYLKRAIDKDPAYKRIAENDADIIDLLKDLMSQKTSAGDEKKVN
nr:carboxypeptidase-like regulatory domain-containing protein [uncultured Bacteroides sp.]